MRRHVYAWLLLLLSTGCATAALERRVAALERRMDAIGPAEGPAAFSQLGGPEASAPVASVGMSVPFEVTRKSLFGARNSSGTFALVSGNPVVSGTSISSTWANNTLSDIAAEITDSLNRSGKGGMLAALKLVAGTVSAPAVYFTVNTGDGFYQPSAGTVAGAISGADQFSFSASGLASAHSFTATTSSANSQAITATGSGTGPGVFGTGGSNSGAGLQGAGGATNGTGVVGTGTGTGAGGSFTGGTSGAGLVVSSNGNRAAIVMAAASAPAGPNAVGDMYMAAGGVLKVCTVAGTPGTFVSVGSQ